MTDMILHHYETSPYAEKVRLGLGLKGLAWASVEIPVIMPKPDLTVLSSIAPGRSGWSDIRRPMIRPLPEDQRNAVRGV